MIVYEEFDTPLHLERLENVKNLAELKDSINNGEIDGALLRADLITDPFVVAVASHKACQSELKGKLVTKSIYTEIIYNISPSKNISQSLKTFGANADDSSVVVAHFGSDQSMAHLLKRIKCDRLSPTVDWSNLAKVNEIRKLYKIDLTELNSSDLTEAIVSRIAVKGLV